MKIRWYQHSVQGANSMTSLKNRLPREETVTSSQHAKSIVQFVLDCVLDCVSDFSSASAMAALLPSPVINLSILWARRRAGPDAIPFSGAEFFQNPDGGRLSSKIGEVFPPRITPMQSPWWLYVGARPGPFDQKS
jgi:hypothetical protein